MVWFNGFIVTLKSTSQVLYLAANLQVMRAFKNGRTAAQIKADRELIRKARE